MFSPSIDVSELPNFSDSCHEVYYYFVLVYIVSGPWIFLEVVKSDLGFLKVGEAFRKDLWPLW